MTLTIKIVFTLLQIGLASWYGPGFQGHKTASGEIYNQEELTAASQTLPMNSKVLVMNERNGKSVLVRITDRGPFIPGRVLDLSWKAAYDLDMLEAGITKVRIFKVT